MFVLNGNIGFVLNGNIWFVLNGNISYIGNMSYIAYTLDCFKRLLKTHLSCKPFFSSPSLSYHLICFGALLLCFISAFIFALFIHTFIFYVCMVCV